MKTKPPLFDEAPRDAVQQCMLKEPLEVAQIERPLSIAILIESIRRGIQDRGYYVAVAELLAALWPSESLPREEKIRRLEVFGADHNWRVGTCDNVDSALFEPAHRR